MDEILDIEYIFRCASVFRNALEYVSEKQKYGRLNLFARFPNGCCRWTSDLLATYLIDCGVAMERIQVGDSETKQGGYTHCWVMIDEEIYVDITADQFNGKPYFKKYEPISDCFVVERDTYLYELFNKTKTYFTHNVGIESYSGDIPHKLRVVYDAAVRYIESGV